MAAETNATPSSDLMPPKMEEFALHSELSRLTKEAKQRYVLNQIKKLVEGCETFIALVPGECGFPEIIASTDLREDSIAILGDAVDNFSHYLDGTSLRASPRFPHSWSTRRWKGKKPIRDRVNDLAAASITYPFQRPMKRHRASTIDSREAVDNTGQRGERKLRVVNEGRALQIRVDDHDQLQRWFKEAFVAMQQVACRIIAKMWIKRIHPRKQSTHPYNGGVPRSEERNPERTRPPYWPTSVPHKEPDHIGRDDRTSLLVHLLTSTPLEVITNPPDPHNAQFVTSADLLDCLDSRKPDLKEGVWDIIEQVCRARDLMEQYEAGEIDGDALVFLNNYAHTARSSYAEVDSEDPERSFLLQGTALQTESLDGSEEETQQLNCDGVFTPISSTHDSPLDQIHFESKPPKYRKRDTVVTESSSTHRSSVHRSSKPSASIGRRMVQELPYRSPSAMRKPGCQREDLLKAQMTEDHRVNTIDDSQSAPVMAQSLPTKDCEQEHKVQSPAMDMMHMMPYIRTCHQPLGMQQWMGMMPNMGPEPPDRVFGFHPHVMAGAPESALAYFGQAAQEMDSRLAGGGILLTDTLQYHEFHDNPQDSLSMSVTGMYQQGVAQPLDMTSTNFYAHQP
ncbi:hypothetical protein PV08_01043 [Exophiala spinifera]|uniref:Subtelomeric hrmA-associated cluster protein AFUB-079030/YDR124W-like helical bundle domain-containing protein n=1 Tax=Exophiala spinifera TaxID=91928 RepID=A0A0D2BNH6_9EURO|nr:uncharacterized protein PV08_01043 [Exophiala spinifera]KIW20468.1 hypothetical protein PV08_01043 [Exophiala spinifera]